MRRTNDSRRKEGGALKGDRGRTRGSQEYITSGERKESTEKERY